MRLLLVEEQPEILRALMGFLVDEGCIVDTADNGEDGLRRGATQEYDAIVMDAKLSTLDGFPVLEELRRRNKATPVLMIATRADLKVGLKGLDTSAVDYLVAPFMRSELIARVQALVRGTAEPTPSVIEIGAVAIDTTKRTVTVNGTAVAFTAKEYCLLELLATHRGSLVTRRAIYQHLFDEYLDDYATSVSNLVDVYVSNIRRKIGGSMITTRRGVGYIIEG